MGHRRKRKELLRCSKIAPISGLLSNRKWLSKFQIVPYRRYISRQAILCSFAMLIFLERSATPVHRGTTIGKHANIPDHPPPPGYICYRCGEKGKSAAFDHGVYFIDTFQVTISKHVQLMMIQTLMVVLGSKEQRAYHDPF